MSTSAASQTIPPSDSPAHLSEMSRVTGVFASPKSAFTDIVAHPKWYVPMIIIFIVSMGFVTALNQRIGFERIIQQQMDQNPRTQNMPADQRAQAAKLGLTVGRSLAFVGAAIGPVISVLVVGGVMMFIANSMLGCHLRYSQMCAIAAYAFLTTVISTVLTTIVMFIRSPDDFDIKNPLAFNLGAFLSDSTPKWLHSLATSLDVFSLWTIALIAIGIMVSTRKLTFGKAFVAVLIPWAILIFGKAGLAAFSG